MAQNGQRLTLVIPDQTPLRAAAKTVRGFRFEGRTDGHAVFSFPAAPDVAALVIEAFEPQLSPSSRDAINVLVLKNAELSAAVAAKEFDQSLGFDACLKTIPMSHQIAAANFAWARFGAGARGTGLLMEQGTGKSLVAIALANALYRSGRIQWGMVIAPNSLKGTWGGPEGEILTHTGDGITPWITIPKGTRKERLRLAGDHFLAPDGLNWIITNYENFSLDARRNRTHRDLLDGWKALPEAARGLLVVDESTMVKNVQAKRTLALMDLANLFAYVLILTGTPVTSSPLDVFGQFEVMEKGSLGFHSYLAFDRTYALRQQRRLASGQAFQEVVGFQNLDDLERRVSGLSYRARAADCLDLPAVVTKRIPVTLTPEQARVIKELKSDMMAELDGNETVDGRNILTRYLRMAQVIGGYVGVLDEEGRPSDRLRAFVPNPKLDALTEYLELLFDDPTQKAAVFAQYRAEIEAIRDMAREHGWKPAVFYGGTSTDDREEGLQRFRKDPDSRLFVGQYQTGSKGLTLVEAATVAFYSLSFSLEDFLQARKRVHRIGQTQTVTEAYFLGQIAGRRGPRQTLDHHILEALRSKQNFADLVTGDFRKILGAL